jgi:hypothetical protein
MLINMLICNEKNETKGRDDIRPAEELCRIAHTSAGNGNDRVCHSCPDIEELSWTKEIPYRVKIFIPLPVFERRGRDAAN